MGTWDRESKGLTSRADRRQDSLVKLVCRAQWKALTRVAGYDRRYLRLIVSAKPYRLQESSSPATPPCRLTLARAGGWLSNTPSCSPPPTHHTSPSRRLYRSADIGPPPPHHMFVCFPRPRTLYIYVAYNSPPVKLRSLSEKTMILVATVLFGTHRSE